MKKKLDFLFSIMLMLCATLIIAVIPTEKDAAIYGDTLRLHILASSDSEADQSLKYDIRNKILDKYGELLKETGSIEAAEEKAAADAEVAKAKAEEEAAFRASLVQQTALLAEIRDSLKK